MDTAAINIRDCDMQSLRSLMLQHLPGVQAWAYGSRVNGTAHAASDLDIALVSPDGAALPVEQLSSFRKALSDSNIPILVDSRDLARLPTDFQQEINRFHAVLF